MSNASLPTLPVELLHRIFDHLDIRSILLSIRSVCKNLYAVTNSYDRFKLTSNSFSYSDIRLICRLIQLENIIALDMSYYIDNQGRLRLFSSDFDLRQLTRLNELTLDKMIEIDLANCLQNIATRSLISLKIYFRNNQKINNGTITLLSSLIVQFNIQKLHLRYDTYMNKYIRFSVTYSLRDLTISSCTCYEYVAVLKHCPRLQRFVIDHCAGFDHTILASCTGLRHDQLNFLAISNYKVPTEYIDSFLSFTPALEYLQLISIRSKFDRIFDGVFWSQLSQTKLTALHHLDFMLKYHFVSADNFSSMSSIIASFQTPYWLTDKHWFVTCDYIISTSDIVIYTNSLGATDGEVLIRNEALSVDQVHIFTRSRPNNVNDLQQEQVCMKHSLSAISSFQLYSIITTIFFATVKNTVHRMQQFSKSSSIDLH